MGKDEDFLVEVFWAFQWYRKKLSKSHDYSRLFSQEKRRLKTCKLSNYMCLFKKIVVR